MENESFLKTQQINLKELISAWQQFLEKNNWLEVIQDYEPISSKCGLIYELPNFLNRANEGFAIADMRNLSFAQPHYHSNNETEVYFVLQGTAVVVVGGHKQQVYSGDIVVIPPNQSHFTIPDNEFVIAIVNTPPYNPENYHVLTKSDTSVGFDYDQFRKLVSFNKINTQI